MALTIFSLTLGWHRMALRQVSAQEPAGSLQLPMAYAQQAQVTASDGAPNDSFGEGGNTMHGEGVAISGDTAIVGAWRSPSQDNRGAAYAYFRNGTSWTQQQKILPNAGVVNNQRFGFAVGVQVSLIGSIAVVGAPGENFNQGAAYVFTRSGNQWFQQQRLTASDAALGDQFGSSIAISGNTVVVGAWMGTVGANSRQGSAYVFTRTGATWTQQQKLIASDGITNDLFGGSIAIAGDTAVVGARQDFAAPNGTGKAYVFVRSGNVWTQQQALTAADAISGDVFGNAVAINSNADTIVVGAYKKNDISNPSRGAVYVFVRSGNTWSQQQKLLNSLGQLPGQSGEFGEAVAVDGDTIVAGAPMLDGFVPTRRGVVYVFDRSGTSWTEKEAFTSPVTLSNLGSSVSLSGDSFIASAPGEKVGSNQGQGSAYVFATGKELSINDVSMPEGDSGTTMATFTVTLSAPDTHPIVVDYSTGDLTARAGEDYVSTSGILTFAPGETVKTISVPVNGDTIYEPSEFYVVQLANAVNAKITKSQGLGTILNDDPAPVVQLSSSSYTVNEGDGHVTITVTRTGNLSGSSKVSYKTTDTDTFTVNCAATQGQAYGRCDFGVAVGTLTFGPGETSKSFDVSIVNDGIAEGDETFGVALTSWDAAVHGTPINATVTIHDNETVNQPNPILQTNAAGVSFFVRQHYLDFLGREPEPGEPWSAILNGCGDQFNVDPNNPAIGCDRIMASGAFFGSPEFKTKGFYVIDMYRLTLNRLPTYTEFSNDLASLTGTSEQDTFARRAAYANNFVIRPDVANIYGAMNNNQFVDALMGGSLGQAYNLTTIHTTDPANPDTGNKVTLTSADLINGLNGGTLTQAQALRAIAQSDEISLQAEAVNAFVGSQYYGYLRRAPDQAGFNAWVNYLKANPNDFRTMINGFENSNEYRLRFGP